MPPKTAFLALGALLASALVTLAAPSWRPLFNGRDLTGWEKYLAKPFPTSEVPGEVRDAAGKYTQVLGVDRDPLNCFSVVEVDGRPAIRLSGEGQGTLGTKESFSNYHLRFQFKWGQKKYPPGNDKAIRGAGLLYHGHGAHGEGDPERRWMPHQQFQIQEHNCGEFITSYDSSAQVTASRHDEKRIIYDEKGPLVLLSPVKPNPARCWRSLDAEKPVGEWNTLELLCVGDRAVHIVNGQVVMRISDSRRITPTGSVPLVAGPVLFQMEGAEIFFRDVEIQPLQEFPQP